MSPLECPTWSYADDSNRRAYARAEGKRQHATIPMSTSRHVPTGRLRIPAIIVLVPPARRSGHYRRTAGSAKIAVLMPEGIRVGDRGVGSVGPLLPVEVDRGSISSMSRW